MIKLIVNQPPLVWSVIFILILFSLTGCSVLKSNSKYSFADGVYHTKRVAGGTSVYVLNVDDDTIAVFPVLMFKDSTAILTNKRVNYTGSQKKFKDNKVTHNFYNRSIDFDLMTIAAKYRPAAADIPNQLNTNFNGALYLGYRIDEYSLNYKRTPLNIYKQSIRHIGYSAGYYAGIGNALIDQTSISRKSFELQYEGVLFITGIAANVAVGKLTVGISGGADFLMDKYHKEWIYEGKPCFGFTLGLDLQ